MQHQPADDGDGREDQHDRRNAQDIGIALAELQDRLDVDDLGAARADLEGQAAGRGEHGEGGDERHHAAEGDQQAVDQTAAQTHEQGGEQDAAEAVLLGGHRRRPDGGQGDHRAYGEVDTAADDDERDADGDDPDDGRLGEHELEVLEAEELLGCGEGADEDEGGEDDEEGEVAEVGASTPPSGGGMRAGRPHRRCRGPGRGGGLPF